MLYDSNLARNELFGASAVVGAHASFREQGFRQRDVKFLMELFNNWIKPAFDDAAGTVQNTQVMRYLEWLIKEGYARKVTKSGQPRYRLTRTGLLELVSRLVNQGLCSTGEQFLFLHYFLKNYKSRIETLVKVEGALFPYSLKIELEALLDIKALVKAEYERAERELKRLDRRIDDATKTSELISAGLRKGQVLADLIEEVEKLYPYELNSQKPLSELIHDLVPDQRAWELTDGNLKRVAEIWQPAREMLRCYLQVLRELKAG